MSNWYLWTKRDLGSGGWAWDPATSSPTNQSLDEVVGRWASPRTFAQLEPAGRVTTEGTPIVSAVWDAAADRWVFVLRGVGGMFRGAGTTQVALAPVGVGLQRAWPAFFAALGPEGIADLAELNAGAEPPTPRVETHQVAEVLHLLAQEATVTTLDVEPTETVDLYGAVLRGVPDTAARRVCWSTCHVPTEISSHDRIVTGRWPENLAKAWPQVLNRLQVVRNRTSRSEAEPPGASRRRTLAWLSRYGARSTLLRDSSATSVAEFLAEVDARRPLTVEEVVEELDVGTPPAAVAERLAASPEVARELVRRHPAEAEAVMVALAPRHPLRTMLLLDFVLDSRSEAGNRIRERLRDEALGGRPGPVGDEVAAAVTAEEFARLADLALVDLKGNDEELLRVEPWLARHHVTRESAPDLFAFDIQRAVRLARTGKPTVAAELLGEGPARLGRAALVVAALGLEDPDLPAFLTSTLGSRPDRHAVPRLFDRVDRPTPRVAKAMVNELANLTAGDAATPEARQALAAGIMAWLAGAGLAPAGPFSGVLLSLATGYGPTELVGRATWPEPTLEPAPTTVPTPVPAWDPGGYAPPAPPQAVRADTDDPTSETGGSTSWLRRVLPLRRGYSRTAAHQGPSGSGGTYPSPPGTEVVRQGGKAPVQRPGTSIVPWLLAGAGMLVALIVLVAVVMAIVAGGSK